MKVFLSTILLLISWRTAAQKAPFFEQIAFDYFQKEIYPKQGIKGTIHVLDSLAAYFQIPGGSWPDCLKTFTLKDLKGVNASSMRILDLRETDNLKKAKAKRGNKIQCYVVESMDMNSGNQGFAVVQRWLD